MGLSRQEYWSGLPCPLPEDLPNPRMEPESPVSPTLQVNSLPTEPPGKPPPPTVCFALFYIYLNSQDYSLAHLIGDRAAWIQGRQEGRNSGFCKMQTKEIVT